MEDIGLGVESNSSVSLNFINGKLAKKLRDGESHPDECVRVNKNGKEVREVYYDTLKGVLKGIEEFDSDYGKQIKKTFDANGVIYTIFINWKSNLKDGVVKRMPNLKGGVMTILKPTKDDRDRTSLLVMQYSNEGNGYKPIKYAFTNDNPNGMPLPTKEVKLGKEVPNYDKQEEFLYQVFKVESDRINKESAIPYDVNQEPIFKHEEGQPIEKDDIPF